MKFINFLLICILGMAAVATAQNTKFQLPPPDNKRNFPKITGSGGGSGKQGIDLNLNAHQRVWESQNKRHSLDASAGYSQHLGGASGSSRPQYGVGAGYTYHFG